MLGEEEQGEWKGVMMMTFKRVGVGTRMEMWYIVEIGACCVMQNR